MQTSSRFLSLRFFGTRDGQRFKTQVLTFLTGRGWRVVSESIQPGHIKGRNACCLAAICLPLGFAADRTPDVVTVNLVSDGPPPLVGEHIHKPQSLDNDQWICVVCELVMTSHEVNHARAAQNALLRAEKKAEREALILANPEIKVREDRNKRTAIIFVGVVIALVILGALIQAAMTAHSSAMSGSPSSARQVSVDREVAHHPSARPAQHCKVDNIVVIGCTYSAKLMVVLNDDVWGPSLDPSPAAFCKGMDHATSHAGSGRDPSADQMREIEPGYDEVHQGTRVVVIDGPAHGSCMPDFKFYRVRLVSGSARFGAREGYIMEAYLNN